MFTELKAVYFQVMAIVNFVPVAGLVVGHFSNFPLQLTKNCCDLSKHVLVLLGMISFITKYTFILNIYNVKNFIIMFHFNWRSLLTKHYFNNWFSFNLLTKTIYALE